jgi:membrane-bound metal-dependent hydrolase YbcI (DUF457 family)
MSTIGHLVVGAAASNAVPSTGSRAKYLLFVVLVVVVSIAPDVDLLLRMLGGPVGGLVDHRGPTHSLVAALAVTGLMGALAKAFRMPPSRIMVAAGISIGSHALLDSLTPGPGVEWLWPFLDTRLPSVALLPIAPIDHLLTIRGMLLLAAEVVVLAPFLVAARLIKRSAGQRS